MLPRSARRFATLVVTFVASCGCVAPTAGQADTLVVRPHGQRVVVHLHQILRVVRPAEFADWQVDYAEDIVKPLDSAQQMRSPDADGWRFEAIGRGETDIVVTPIATSAPHGPAPPRFSLTVRVS